MSSWSVWVRANSALAWSTAVIVPCTLMRVSVSLEWWIIITWVPTVRLPESSRLSMVKPNPFWVNPGFAQ